MPRTARLTPGLDPWTGTLSGGPGLSPGVFAPGARIWVAPANGGLPGLAQQRADGAVHSRRTSGLVAGLAGRIFTQAMPTSEGATVAQVLAEAHAGFLRAESGLPAPELSQTVWAEAAEFAALLVRGESHNALAMMHRMLDSGHSLIDFEMHVIQPAMYQIGEQWQQNQISVAQEHMASAIVRWS